MTLMGKDRFETKDDFIKLAENNDIRGAKAIIAQVETTVASFRTYAEQANVPSAIIEAIEKNI